MALCKNGGENKRVRTTGQQFTMPIWSYEDRHSSYQQKALLGATKFEKVTDQRVITPLNVKKAESKMYS